LIPDPIGNPTNLDFISSEDANAKNAKHDF
jgi:hypothetical protein